MELERLWEKIVAGEEVQAHQLVHWMNEDRADPLVLSHCVLRLSREGDKSPEFIDKALSWALIHWDHYIEGVRNECCRIVYNCLLAHQNKCDQCSPKSGIRLSCSTVARVVNHLGCTACSVRAKYKVVKSVMSLLSKSNTAQFVQALVPASVGAEDCLRYFSTMLVDLAADQTISPVVGELYAYCARKLNHTSDQSQAFWTSNLCDRLVLSLDARLIDGLTYRYLLHFVYDAQVLQNCLSSINEFTSHPRALSCKLSCCKAALGQRGVGVEYWTDFLNTSTMLSALVHSDLHVRTCAIEFFGACAKPTRFLTTDDQNLFRVFLICNINELDSAFRQRILTAVKKTLIRLRDSGNHMLKYGNVGEHERELCEYDVTINWLLSFVEVCCAPQANSSRRTTALAMLDMLLFQDYLASPDNNRLWKHLDMDSKVKRESLRSAVESCLSADYQDNQECALPLLAYLNQAMKVFPQNVEEQALRLSVSTKPVDTVEASYHMRLAVRLSGCPTTSLSAVHNLVALLKDHIDFAEKDLLSASLQAPMHGVIHCINAVLADIKWDIESVQQWHALVSDTLVPLCLRACACVSTIVHSMSPEGLLPVPIESPSVTDDVTSDLKNHSTVCQSLLVCCWRTQKETSAVFASLSHKAPYPQVMDDQTLDALVEFYWCQLTECKHRGAFETAYAGFIRLCHRVWSLPQCGRTPHNWVHRLLHQMRDHTSLSRLCATRRSAGLPFLVLAISVTEPISRDHYTFHMLVNILVALARDVNEVQETRVHSLNMLKALFKESKLSDASMTHAGDALILVLDSLGVSAWCIRNAASQLFSGLILRVFGVPRFRNELVSVVTEVEALKLGMTCHEFFTRFPLLHGRLYSFLQVAVNDITQWQTSLFPLLILLSRLRPSPSSMSWSLKPFIPGVFTISLTSPSFRMRELAASVLVSLCGIDPLIEHIVVVLNLNCDQNAVHGALACIQILFKNITLSSLPKAMLQWIQHASNNLFHSWCFMNQCLFLKILTDKPCLLPTPQIFIRETLAGQYDHHCIHNLTKHMAKYLIRLLIESMITLSDLQMKNSELSRCVIIEILGSNKLTQIANEELQWIIDYCNEYITSSFSDLTSFEGERYLRKVIRSVHRGNLPVHILGTVSMDSAARYKTKAGLASLNLLTKCLDVKADIARLQLCSDCSQPVSMRWAAVTALHTFFKTGGEVELVVGGVLNLLSDDCLEVRSSMASIVHECILKDKFDTPVNAILTLNIIASILPQQTHTILMNMQTEREAENKEQHEDGHKLFDKNEAQIYFESYQVLPQFIGDQLQSLVSDDWKFVLHVMEQ